MSEQNEKTQSTKKFRRKLTPFLCQEMLFDFATDQLDGERKAAVEEFLKTDKECQSILEAIRRGLAYSDQLSATALKPEVLGHLRESENALSIGRRYSKWESWPEAVRWSLTALGISAAAAAFVAIVPWHRLQSVAPQKGATVEIAKIADNTAERLKNMQEANEIDSSAAPDEGSGDEEAGPVDAKLAKHGSGDEDESGDHIDDHSGDHEDPPAPSAKVLAMEAAAAKAAALKEAKKEAQQPTKPVGTPIIIMAPTPAGAAAAVAINAPQSIGKPAGETANATNDKRDPKARGFVYRAFMTLKNLEEVTPKITELIREQGGEKAGEVELGWKRGTGRYYHFAMPEDNEEKLLEQLRAFGPVRISKDPHPRIMPPGQVRFILWIESAN